MSRETVLLWPEARLGCPLRSSYRGTVDPQWKRTEIEDGPARYRRVKNAERRTYTVEFMWTLAQLADFETFHDSVLDDGMRWFMMPQLVGAGMRPMFCHMLGGWQIAPQPDPITHVLVSFEVEAFHSAASEPALGLSGSPIDAGTAAAPSPDHIDALVVTDPRPNDIVNSLTPGAIF